MLTVHRYTSNSDALKSSIEEHLYYLLARIPTNALPGDFYLALAWSVRDRLIQRWISTQDAHAHLKSRRLYYLSAEYSLGPHLRNALCSLNLESAARSALADLGVDLETIAQLEPEPMLGSSELGRLTACALDAMASLAIPAIAYGLRYEFGAFAQEIRNERQQERATKWLAFGNPWEILRPELTCKIGLRGCTEYYQDSNGKKRVRWLPECFVKGIAYDTPIPGYGVATINTLRLWSAEAYELFEIQAFNLGDYQRKIQQKINSESISKILYLDDEPVQNNSQRLEQQYFLVACAMQDVLCHYQCHYRDFSHFIETVTIQINDAHPALAVAELMRLLVDEHALGWEEAWEIVSNTCNYTSHSLLPDMLEHWPVELFGKILPRHLEIIYEINHRFLATVRARWPNDPTQVTNKSLFDEQGGKRLRLTHLACVGSHSISGMLDQTNQLPRDAVLRDFYELDSQHFVAIANGVSPRRFLILANPALTSLIDSTIGTNWRCHPELLSDLTAWAEDANFRATWRNIKYANKQRLSAIALAATGIVLDPASMFDIQVKRIREYKRQHLNILHIISRYFALKNDPHIDFIPRTWIFAGKAAPGAFIAQLILELILGVAKVINNDPHVKDYMRVIFLPNFGIKDAAHIYPAADLSEQLTTAGKEPSGAGTIKFALNGALTIGSHDGCNLEIQTLVGANNFFPFGMVETQAKQMRSAGYRPNDYSAADPTLQLALDAIAKGYFSNGDQSRFRPLLDTLLTWDSAFALADFNSYVQCQRQVDLAWANPENWSRSSILNTAGAGHFTSDRTVLNYCQRIWNVQPVALEI